MLFLSLSDHDLVVNTLIFRRGSLSHCNVLLFWFLGKAAHISLMGWAKFGSLRVTFTLLLRNFRSALNPPFFCFVKDMGLF